MKTTTPFCCDINSGSAEERNEFKRLYQKALNNTFSYNLIYYGWNKDGRDTCVMTHEGAVYEFGNIIPLSEGIAILKEMVGEEEKETTYTEQEIDFAYLAGVFNVSGIDGLYNEIQRLKSLGKNPHDIIIEGRNLQPKP